MQLSVAVERISPFGAGLHMDIFHLGEREKVKHIWETALLHWCLDIVSSVDYIV